MGPRHITAADLPGAATALGEAFVDDPMTSWLADQADPAERVRRTAAGFFSPGLAAGLHRGHTYVIGAPGAIDAVAVWSPPDVGMLGEADIELLAADFATQFDDSAIERLITLGALTEEHHPVDRPHFYLFLLGAVTKGRGDGAEVMAPVLRRCDEDGIGAYLESSNPRNMGFYERFGFEVTWAQRPTPNGPLISGMWRDPQR